MSSFRGKLSLQILPITSFLVNAKIRESWDHIVNMKCNVFFIQLLQTFFILVTFSTFFYFNLNFYTSMVGLNVNYKIRCA